VTVGITITATAVSTDPRIHSSIEHAARTATECIDRAGLTADQIDLVINTGVYRDANMSEPAMAALIQKSAGLTLDYVKYPNSPTFSFDLMNGACGVLNAVQVGAAFIEAGSAEHVLVLSGDAHPSNNPAEARRTGFPYATLGAALLLGRASDPGAGFGRVHTATAPDSGDGSSAVGYVNTATMGTAGRRTITVRRGGDYADRLVALAADTARAYAADEGIDLSATLLVTSQPTPDFAARVAARLGVNEWATVAVEGISGDPHTSALTLAYHQAVAAGRDRAYGQVLFVAAGAGLTCACVVYRAPERLPLS
jgi:3-oxoacyl-[acyl-carrier-protein] synthase III